MLRCNMRQPRCSIRLSVISTRLWRLEKGHRFNLDTGPRFLFRQQSESDLVVIYLVPWVAWWSISEASLNSMMQHQKTPETSLHLFTLLVPLSLSLPLPSSPLPPLPPNNPPPLLNHMRIQHPTPRYIQAHHNPQRPPHLLPRLLIVARIPHQHPLTPDP